jgi:hypothetical protein
MTTELSFAYHEPAKKSPLVLLSSSIHAWSASRQRRSRGDRCSAAHIESGFIHSTDAPDIGEELITPMLVREIFRPAESTGRLLGAPSLDPEDCAHA